MEGEFSSVSTPELVSEITTLAGHLNAGNARFLALIAELDRRRGWVKWGAKSCAHWLNWQCGIGLGAAREKGRVSYFKARELTREAIQQRDQRLSFHTEPDGSMVIRGRVPAEVGALVQVRS